MDAPPIPSTEVAFEICSLLNLGPILNSSYGTLNLSKLYVPFVDDARTGTKPPGEPPRGAPHRNPVAGALQVALPIQVCVQAMAGPLFRPRHPQEVPADLVRLLLQR